MHIKCWVSGLSDNHQEVVIGRFEKNCYIFRQDSICMYAIFSLVQGLGTRLDNFGILNGHSYIYSRL